MLSGTADEARIGKALAAGALAGIPKSAALAVLVAAVRRAAQGVEVMHPERRRQFIEAYLHQQERGRVLGRRLASLTERERSVLDRLAKGQRAQSIADECVVSVTTVRTQIRAILGKLGSAPNSKPSCFSTSTNVRPRSDNVVKTTLSDLAAARCRESHRPLPAPG